MYGLCQQYFKLFLNSLEYPIYFLYIQISKKKIIKPTFKCVNYKLHLYLSNPNCLCKHFCMLSQEQWRKFMDFRYLHNTCNDAIDSFWTINRLNISVPLLHNTCHYIFCFKCRYILKILILTPHGFELLKLITH